MSGKRRAGKDPAAPGSYSAFVSWRMCGRKRRFADEWEAIHACLEHSKSHGACRYYKCPQCGGYHITSHVDGDAAA